MVTEKTGQRAPDALLQICDDAIAVAEKANLLDRFNTCTALRMSVVNAVNDLVSLLTRLDEASSDPHWVRLRIHDGPVTGGGHVAASYVEIARLIGISRYSTVRYATKRPLRPKKGQTSEEFEAEALAFSCLRVLGYSYSPIGHKVLERRWGQIREQLQTLPAFDCALLVEWIRAEYRRTKEDKYAGERQEAEKSLHAVARPPENPQLPSSAPEFNPDDYIGPDRPKSFYKVLGIGRTKFKQLEKAGELHVHRLTSKSIYVLKTDFERFRRPSLTSLSAAK